MNGANFAKFLNGINMIKVTVNDFSSIKKACFELGEITLLIGPQASGKSVLCKLNYFFINILDSQHQSIREDLSFSGYQNIIKEKFIDWFPISAWGNGLFSISFRAGDFEIKISRRSYQSSPTDKIKISISDNLKNDYSSLSKLKQSIEKKFPSEDDLDFRFMIDFREAAEKSLKKLLGNDYIERQIFIPAGRSFFTNLGKALAIFEHGRVLDPLTLAFGRIYTSFRDSEYLFFSRPMPKKNDQLIQDINKILGGVIQKKGKGDFVLTDDGRKIPFSALSSGQQELLPLLTVLPYLFSGRKMEKTLTYIEEPEAHLFPEAQSRLISALSSILNFNENSLNMVLTTHSPYVLSKFNNLIKASMVANISAAHKSSVNKIIPETSWLNPNKLKAYAIVNSELINIVDEQGFISSEYLDGISEEISREYEELLKIEYPE